MYGRKTSMIQQQMMLCLLSHHVEIILYMAYCVQANVDRHRYA